MVLNILLEEQLKKHFKEPADMPPSLKNLLQEISDTYNECDTNLRHLPAAEEASEVLSELNSKLRNEAEELKKAHNELGRILNSVNQGFFSRDMLTNRYTYLSLGCEKIYGYSVEEFLEDPMLWYNVIHPNDRAMVAQDDERLNNEEELSSQYRIITKENKTKWIELKIIPHFRNGKLTRVDGVINDISARKQVETERELMIKELLKSNADLKQFSFITSHNLRAPLSNILGILNLVDYANIDKYNLGIIDMLKVSAQQLNETINDLNKILIIKNNTNPELSDINIESTFNRVIASFSNALREVDAKVFVDFKTRLVIQNKVYLESIFVNLVSNALRYRSKERKLVLQVTSREDENGNVIVSFSDNGMGIDLQRHKDRIFGLYQRFHSNIEGQGLGLFIIKSQIEATGGQIDVESEVDKGTTFTLTLKNQPAQVPSMQHEVMGVTL